MLEIIVTIILLGIALSADAFAVSVTCGLTYSDINKRKSFFIAGVFGFMQAFMPLIGYWLVELISQLVGQNAGEKAGQIASIVVTWIAFTLLILIGVKMIIDALKSSHKNPEEKEIKKFSIKQVLYFGIATSIDALSAGVALHASTANNVSIWWNVSVIGIITFTISILGLFFGHQIEKIFKGKYEITQIIGGLILIILAAWIVIN